MDVTKKSYLSYDTRLAHESSQTNCESVSATQTHLKDDQFIRLNTTKLIERSIEPLALLKDLFTSNVEHCGLRHDFFMSDLSIIFDHHDSLRECKALSLPLLDSNGVKKDKINTYFCKSMEDILCVANRLDHNELGLVVYLHKLEDYPNILSVTLSLTSNRGCQQNRISALTIFNEDFTSNPERIDFFGIKFDLHFDDHKKLNKIMMLRGVNPYWRRKSICTTVSLNCLEIIYRHYGADRPQLKFTASHIATVKFCYPLNRFYLEENRLHLRDIDPSESNLRLVDIVQSSNEDISDFSYYKVTDGAHCPHRSISLKKFLNQFKLRNLFSELSK